MSYQDKLHPALSEEAAEAAQELLDSFKNAVAKEAKHAVDEFYFSIIHYVESDSWTNFRNQIMDGMCDYKNGVIHAAYDFRRVREKIYQEYRDDIIKDLNQDMLKEIESLKSQIESLWNRGI